MILKRLSNGPIGPDWRALFLDTGDDLCSIPPVVSSARLILEEQAMRKPLPGPREWLVSR
jgi:hypothetical protein